MQELINRAKELLADGTVGSVSFFVSRMPKSTQMNSILLSASGIWTYPS